MTSININIDDNLSVTSRGIVVPVAIASLNDDIRGNLFVYGLQQKLADAASGAAKSAAEGAGADWDAMSRDERRAWSEANSAAIVKETEIMIGKALDALYRGDWSTRQAGEGLSERDRVARSIMKQLMKAKASDADWKTFTGLSDAEQAKRVAANVEKNAEVIAPLIDEEMKRREAARKAKAGLATKVSIDL